MPRALGRPKRRFEYSVMSNCSDTAAKPTPRDDIAIVGMECVFPAAANLQAFWDNIVLKKDAVSDPPPECDADLYFDPNSGANDRVYTKKGGFLGELSTFDPIK